MSDGEEIWHEHAARVLNIVLAETYESDWMEGANCQVDNTKDTSFIREPDEVSDRRWAKVCSKCQVFTQCFAWANHNDVHGVYVAGEYRE